MIEEILSGVKVILDIDDTSKDDILSFYIDDIENAVLAYCRIEFVPKQLYGLIAQIAAEIYTGSDGRVASLTEGDRKVEFESRSQIVLNAYKERLKPFRNTAGRVPSEVVRL
ncbi:MAG: phage head-tail connector protein [Firmicutes bacterium]|nr:phage head-tail connector protein [Bacillota bacterium]